MHWLDFIIFLIICAAAVWFIALILWLRRGDADHE